MIKIDGKDLIFDHYSDGEVKSIFGTDKEGEYEKMIISTKKPIRLTPETVIYCDGREWKIKSKLIDKAGDFTVYTLLLRKA
jgi:hypothetical protein